VSERYSAEYRIKDSPVSSTPTDFLDFPTIEVDMNNIELTRSLNAVPQSSNGSALRKLSCSVMAAIAILSGSATSAVASEVKAQYSIPKGADNFYKSDAVSVQKISFNNQYGMKVSGNLFAPKNLDKSKAHAAIIVGHPMGAVKEQSANLYATKMAEQGFVTLSLDLSFWGQSEGRPQNAVSPDIYAEDFSAAVDFLRTQAFVDKERIGAIGICGSGGFVISAAKIDPRLKAIATVSMYDMGGVHRNGLNNSTTLEQRKAYIAQAANQRDVEFAGGKVVYTDGVKAQQSEVSNPIQQEFFDFYRTPRGKFTPEGRSPEDTTRPTLTSDVKFMNFYPFQDIETISPRPMLFITGDQAHSKEFSEQAYKLAGEPKELVVIPGAGHVDLYDRVDLIPWSKLDTFFTKNLK
jgi:fermentation-respiration switch protein FrsA (DUF1100 family)